MIRLISRIISIVYGMLFVGEPVNNIKSACYVEYANYLHDNKKIEKAITYYNKAISLNINNYYAHGSLAATFFEKKQFKQSLEYCKSASSIKAGISVDILSHVIYEALGEYSLAKEMLQHILEFYKKDLVAAYDRLSYAYFQVNMHKEAEYYCKEALKINPSAANFHYNLGMINLAQNKLLEAKGEFNKVLELANSRRYKRYAINKIVNINNLLGQP